MASASASWIQLVVFLLAIASAMAVAAPAKAKPAPATPAADTPSTATDDRMRPTNIITLLNEGELTTFGDLLKQSRVDTQIMAQLTDSNKGLTILAPTNQAFEDLKAGTFNGLSNQVFVQMMLYCVLPRFYPPSMLYTLSGKLNTEASGHTGPYKYNITTSGKRIIFSTGVKGNDMLLLLVLYSSQFQLVIYSVDKVPLPYELFGPQPPTPAPAPTKSKHKKKKSTRIAEAPESQDPDDTKNVASSSLTGRWVATLGVLAAAVLVLR